MSVRKYGNTVYVDLENHEPNAEFVARTIQATLLALEDHADREGAALDWASLDLSIEHDEIENRTYAANYSTTIERVHSVRASILGVTK